MIKQLKSYLPRIKDMKRLKVELFLAMLSGLLLNLSYPNIDIEWVAWFGLVPFLISMHRVSSARDAGFVGGVFGFVFAYANLFWLNTLSRFNVFVPIGIVLLGVYGMIFLVIFSVTFFVLKREFPRGTILFAPVVWVAIEYVRSLGDLGFPWFYLAHTQWRNLRVIQICDLTGVYGISFVVALVNVCIAECMVKFKTRRYKEIGFAVVCAMAAVLVTLLYSHASLNAKKPTSTQKLKVAVVQPNIPQDIKMLAFQFDEIEQAVYQKTIALIRELRGAEIDLVVLPETAITNIEFATDVSVRAELKQFANDLGGGIFLGAMNRASNNGTARIYNSAFLVDGEKGWGPVYNKMHLVPFGETVPYLHYIPFFSEFIVGIEPFARGDELTIFEYGGAKFASLICFESTFPKIARAFVNRGAQFLIVITNDAWYLDSRGPYQHFALSAFRAVETHRWVVRAANTGISGFFSPTGEVVSHTQYGTDGVATWEINLSDRITFYTKYGDLFGILCLMISLCALVTTHIAAKRRSGITDLLGA